MVKEEILIYDFWYQCPFCKGQYSHTTSNPVKYDEIYRCAGCHKRFIVMGLKCDVEVVIKGVDLK